MGIRVNPSKAVVSSISYLEPEAQAQWLEINVLAQASFPDVLSVDVVTPTDLITLATNKGLQDSTDGLADVLIRALTKALADSFTMQDSTDIAYSIEKNLADTQAVVESLRRTVAKALADASSVADSASLAHSKSLADVLSAPADSLSSIGVSKGVADSATITETILTTLIFIRELAEAIGNSDSASLANSLPKAETLASTDSSTRSAGKNLSEGLNLIDNMDGDIEYNIVKLVGELLVSSDGQAIDFATQSSDNVLTSSSGSLTMQDYSDITYFLTDYVGESRAFT